MLKSNATQFQLSADGQILWQEKQGSPLPGVPVAKLVKGEHTLKPVIEILENAHTKTCDAQALKDHLALWLHAHMMSVLEPLLLLGIDSADEGVVTEIGQKVFDGLGIVPREQIEDLIAQLDAEKRAALRQKKIRLGPILIFMPLLNKPAAVRMRALLWCLYHDLPLPANVPADGIVSVAIDDAQANEDFYRVIGYPLYGGRAVRIDMLDRVINAVYDNAKNGKFQARHEMAEWLGCSIEGLYKVLESMGHKKIYDPADEEPQAIAPQDKSENELKEEAKTQEPVDTEQKATENKPELATFGLKRGKAFEKSGRNGFKPDLKSKKEPYKGKSDKKKDFKSKKRKPEKDKNKDRGPRVISIEAKRKEEDSPFAILQQLKTKSDD